MSSSTSISARTHESLFALSCLLLRSKRFNLGAKLDAKVPALIFSWALVPLRTARSRYPDQHSFLVRSYDARSLVSLGKVAILRSNDGAV